MVFRSIANVAISFGLVHIPVRIFTATAEKTIRFHQLHISCGTRIRMQHWCPTDEQVVPLEQIGKGYEYAKDHYVLLTEADFAAVPISTSDNIELVSFVPLAEIDPVYFRQTYFLAPGEGGSKAFVLFRETLEESGRVALGQFALREKEQLVVVRPYKSALALEILHYPDEIRQSTEIAELAGLEAIQVSAKEKQLAQMLVESQTEHFQPEGLHDHYREALEKVITAKVSGQVIVTPKAQESKVVDLIKALEQSIEEARRKREESLKATP